MWRKAYRLTLLLINSTALIFMLYFFLTMRLETSAPTTNELIASMIVGKKTPTVEYKDFISILLTALGVMIAALAAIFALAAVWGFNFLRDEILRAARQTAESEARSVAQTVAIRTAMETRPTQTSGEDAAQIAAAMNGSESQNGQ